MKMSMVCAPVMRMCMICQVCQCPMVKSDEDAAAAFEAALQGICGKYNQCKCGRVVLPPFCDDTNYRKRWRYWNRKLNFYKG